MTINQYIRTGVLFIIIVIIGVFYFIQFYQDNSESKKYDEGILPNKEVSIEVLINDKKIIQDKKNIIYSHSLKPVFVFKISGVKESEVKIFLDGSANILGTNFYGDINIKGKEIIFLPAFTLDPKLHSLSVNVGDVVTIFTFELAFKDDFTTLDKSKWVIPPQRSGGWFKIDNGKLKISPTGDDDKSSIAFLKNLSGDIYVDFELTPIGNNMSTIFYFWDSTINQFVFGSEGNRRIINFHEQKKDTFSIHGQDFTFEKDRRYHIRINRISQQYTIQIRQIFGDETVSPEYKFADNSYLEFTDTIRKDLKYTTADQVGFSLWRNSHGVLIDDFYIREAQPLNN